MKFSPSIVLFAAALLAGCSPKPAGSGTKANRPLPASEGVMSTSGVATLTPRVMPPVQGLPMGGGAMPAGEIGHGAFSRRTPVVEAVAKASGSVVNLGTERIVQTRYAIPILAQRASQLDGFYQQQVLLVPLPPQQKVTRSLGSGVIVDENGYILTNNHVIDRASRVQVALENNEVYDASLVGADEMDDLALIKIALPPGKKLKAIELVEGDEMLLGETVIAMGNPFGLSHSVSVGVLSSTNRPASFQGQLLYTDILQTDAAVNPGSSGGPLLTIEGKLLGLNVAVFENAQSIGFAQPVHRVRQFLARWLSPQILKKQGLGFAVKVEDGAVRVESVSEKSAAQALGLQPGAIITAVNGQATPDLFTFNQRVLGLTTGDTASITWTTKGGDLHSGDLRVEPLRFDDGNELAWKRLGLRLKPVVDKNVVPLRYEGSLPISQIAQIGPAARAGLTPGRYIWKINDTNIQDLTDVSRALFSVNKGDTVTIGIVNFVESAQNMIAHQTFTQVVAD